MLQLAFASLFSLQLAHLGLASAAVLSAFLSGMSRGGFAGSIGLFAVPILSTVLPASDAATALLPPLCILDCIVLYYHHGKRDTVMLRQILPASAVGLLVAWWLVNTVSENATAIFMGSTILTASLLRIVKPNTALLAQSRVHSSQSIRGYLWGALSGFSSFISHTGGAPLMIHVLSVMRDRDAIVATVGIVFAINDAVKVAAYVWLGRFNTTALLVGLGLIPFAIFGYMIGMRYAAKLGESRFQRVSTGLLSLAALWMIISGAVNLMA